MQIDSYNKRYYLLHREKLTQRQRARYRNDSEYREMHKKDMLQRYHQSKIAQAQL